MLFRGGNVARNPGATADDACNGCADPQFRDVVHGGDVKVVGPGTYSSFTVSTPST